MKKFLIILISLFLLVGCGNKYENRKPTIHTLENTNDGDMKAIFESGNYIIVDVRTPEEYDESHIKSAINIPYDAIDENINLDKSKTIMVYCKSGKRSAIAAETLIKLGYKVYDMGAYNSINLDK